MHTRRELDRVTVLRTHFDDMVLEHVRQYESSRRSQLVTLVLIAVQIWRSCKTCCEDDGKGRDDSKLACMGYSLEVHSVVETMQYKVE